MTTLTKYDYGIFWFRRDFRLNDNTALYHCVKQCNNIIPIFIFSPEQVVDKENSYKSNKSVMFMIESLSDLKSQFGKSNKGHKFDNLLTFYGEPSNIIQMLINKLYHNQSSSSSSSSANINNNNNNNNKKQIGIFFNKDYTPYSKKRDKQIEKICKSNKYNEEVECNSFHDVCIFPPGSIVLGSDFVDVYEKSETNLKEKTFKKFTPFYNKCLSNTKHIPHILKFSLSSIKNKLLNEKELKEQIGQTGVSHLISLQEAYLKFIDSSVVSFEYEGMYKIFEGGRINGLNALGKIKRGNYKDYRKNRDFLTYETTQLSPYLKYGCISPREVYEVVSGSGGGGGGKNQDILRQMIWRDFYIHILNSHPEVIEGHHSLKPKYDKIRWNNNRSHFNAWREGRTGFPIVDACMRQLNNTGYMHNRGRLIVASFLIKNLRIDWRWGEKYFAQNLVDYDPAANNGNWQWVAGSGADSQPYFRIFNPWTQAEKYDPDAEYIKKWVPELSSLDSKDIHQWFKPDVREKYNKIRYNMKHNMKLENIEKKSKSYPSPIIDYVESRSAALKMYKSAL
jgi:deoxyribodipyrimidine photo-lyase